MERSVEREVGREKRGDKPEKPKGDERAGAVVFFLFSMRWSP